MNDGVIEEDLPQRLLLVQKPPRSLRLACSVLAPAFSAPPDSASASTSAAVADAAAAAPLIPRLVRKFCLMDSPFPGKSVSRPCRVEVTQRKSWSHAAGEAVLAAVGLGDGGGDGSGAGKGYGAGSSSNFSWGVDANAACKCASGGRGPCTVRASPVRDPCLYIEVGKVSSKSGRRRFGMGGEVSEKDGKQKGLGAERVDAFSAVELRTYPVTTPMVMMMNAAAENDEATGGTTAAPASGEGVKERGEAAVADAIAALRATAMARSLPPSVAVSTYATRLAAGVMFLFLAQPLSESRLFHYLLSAFLGGMIGAIALALRALGNPQRAFLR